MADGEQSTVEQALDAARAEFGVRAGFPPEVTAAAAEAARRPVAPSDARADRRDLLLVTIDPPGSRDLDQAVCIQQTEDDGFRLYYAIADVGFWVDRGGAIEQEAWKRGVTFYTPDRKEPLYPPEISQNAGSLLPDQDRPCILFDFTLDERAEVTAFQVGPAVVRSRAQLTYGEVTEHVCGDGSLFRGKEWEETLREMRRFGELRRAQEAARGGVSLPLVSQHVARMAAERLGYEVQFEQPVASEEWNEQVSLLIGHYAALRMVEGGIGMLRVMGGPEPKAVDKFRRIALAMGFAWPEGMEYAAFIRSLDRTHPRLTPLVWQARPVMRGADYVAFDGEPPADPLHHALAMQYAHATAPLRRLGDRYVLDLLVTLAAGARPTPEESKTLAALPAVMNEAETRESKLERRAVDVAEAWMLRERVGEVFPATCLDVRGHGIEVQIDDPPVRAVAQMTEGAAAPEPGAAVRVRLSSVNVLAGRAEFTLEAAG
ncbi:MAG TPA: RNB domain-containing ribonuclease [Longimicrobium sp.]|jgi:VacB/RNase II family 3'-5' exoribonuclease|uniref:RNB domain-containing ribonuclease n=1 Tax=Longimicrobium sp. TaxID=2029185 RepID=UPI002ED80E40